MGLSFSSGQARSEDAAQSSLSAPAAADAGNPRTITVKTMMAGGLRRNDVMLLTSAGAERVSPARLAQQLAAPSAVASSGPCTNF